ncbi:MAG: hypothetical protein HS126_19165 [Anaerolineales bacterium]|nr:hypothetical protein [Anaerolineales bacterium]
MARYKLVLQIEEDGLLVNEEATVGECGNLDLLQKLQDEVTELVVALYPPAAPRDEWVQLCSQIAELMAQVDAAPDDEEE